jgi:hypothetical protein
MSYLIINFSFIIYLDRLIDDRSELDDDLDLLTKLDITHFN